MKKLCFLLVVLTGISAVYGQNAATSSSDGPLYIVFPANSADLKTVDEDMALSNAQSFIKVAQLLRDNPEYRILIDGHANPVLRTASEEASSLKPLSAQRAEAAATFLVNFYHVDRNRLILTGAGGIYPFGGANDPSLNRRVSFFIVSPY